MPIDKGVAVFCRVIAPLKLCSYFCKIVGVNL